jgi:rubrerythrin
MTTKSRGLERQLELFKIFKMAIKAEQRSQQMYQDAISRCDDAEVKDILESLRDDERRHEKEVKEMYGELKQVFEMEEAAVPKTRHSLPAKAVSKRARK